MMKMNKLIDIFGKPMNNCATAQEFLKEIYEETIDFTEEDGDLDEC